MAYPFAAADVLTAVDLNAMIGAPTQNTQTGTTYTAVLLDAGKTVTLSNASAVTLTIPAQASVSWAANTQLNFLNIGAGTVTITPAAGVTINGTPLTLATSKGGSLVRTASNVWTFIPFSSGEGAANFTNAATGTYTDAGISYKFITFTGSGSLVVDRAGFADVLIVGGGGAPNFSNANGAGAGGYIPVTNYFLAMGTHTITVGAGSVNAGQKGSDSALLQTVAVGGGRGDGNANRRSTGGSGGGVFNAGLSAAILNQGNVGSAGANSAGGGSGGAASGSTGGIGTSSSITGSAVTRAAGGGSTTGTSGGANTGDGGGGNNGSSTGGSGIIIVRVAI